MKWQPPLVFLPGKSHRQQSLASYSPWGSKRIVLNQQLNNNKLHHWLTVASSIKSPEVPFAGISMQTCILMQVYGWIPAIQATDFPTLFIIPYFCIFNPSSHCPYLECLSIEKLTGKDRFFLKYITPYAPSLGALLHQEDLKVILNSLFSYDTVVLFLLSPPHFT